MRVLLGCILLVLLAISEINCMKRARDDDENDEDVFVSAKGNAYQIVDVLFEDYPRYVKRVKLVKEGKKAKLTEGTTGQESTSVQAEKSKQPEIPAGTASQAPETKKPETTAGTASQASTSSRVPGPKKLVTTAGTANPASESSHTQEAKKPETTTMESPKSPFILKVADEQDINKELAFLEIPGKKDGFPEVIEHGEVPTEGKKRENAAVYKYYIMTRFGSDLLDHFNDHTNEFTLPYIRDIALDVLDHLETMHELKFVHRDLKPENICLTQKPGAEHMVSLIDFGYSAPVVETGHGWFVQRRERLGTFIYMSRRAHESKELSAQSDVESLALVVLFFIRNGLPWEYEGEKEPSAAEKAELVKLVYRFWDDEAYMAETLMTWGLPFLPFFRVVKGLVPGQPVNYDRLRDILTRMRFST